MKPNIVLIVADDMGYGDCSCYGGRAFATPHIDALAAQGLRFTDFHSNGAVCSPTRAALLTGRYQQRSGIEKVISAANHRDIGLPLDETTFAEALQAGGYATALFGKWHLGYAPRFNPTRRGFDRFRGFVSGNIDYHSHIDQAGYEDWWADAGLTPEDGYTTDLVTAHGVRFIEENRAHPFCLYLAHECPHYPYQGPDDTAYRTPGDPGPAHGPRPDKAQAYKEMMQSMDAGIGRVVETLDRLGLSENTLVFFFSDNGPVPPGSAGPLRGGKGTLFEGGHRVPAIARWPGVIEAAGETAAPCMGMDLLPTFLAAAEINPPAGLQLDGADLMPLLRGDPPPERALFWRYDTQKAVRAGEWKLLCENPEAPAQLFNLRDDLGERHDRAAEHTDVFHDLTGLLAKWEADVGDRPRLT